MGISRNNGICIPDGGFFWCVMTGVETSSHDSGLAAECKACWDAIWQPPRLTQWFLVREKQNSYVKNRSLPQVEEFKYLGFTFKRSGSMVLDYRTLSAVMYQFVVGRTAETKSFELIAQPHCYLIV